MTESLLVFGGGAHDRDLLTRISAPVPGCHVESTQARGADADWIEAMVFEGPARETLRGGLTACSGVLAEETLDMDGHAPSQSLEAVSTLERRYDTSVRVAVGNVAQAARNPGVIELH